jgi:hypothetical protein
MPSALAYNSMPPTVNPWRVAMGPSEGFSMAIVNGSSRLSYHFAYGALLDGGTSFAALVPLFSYGFYFTMLFRDGIIDCQVIKKRDAALSCI